MNCEDGVHARIFITRKKRDYKKFKKTPQKLQDRVDLPAKYPQNVYR